MSPAGGDTSRGQSAVGGVFTAHRKQSNMTILNVPDWICIIISGMDNKQKNSRIFCVNISIVVVVTLLTVLAGCQNSNPAADPNAIVRSTRVQLANQDSNVIKTSWPSIGCWFWFQEEFEGEGYKRFIDLHEKYAPFELLTTSLRYPGDLTDPKVHDQIKAASLYARSKGMGLVMDLDIRLARDSFKEKYPDELQQIILLREFPLHKANTASISVKGKGYDDHYTYGRNPYEPVATKVLRVYSYSKEGGLIKSGTLKDITAAATSIATKDSVNITVDFDEADRGKTACALVAVTLYTPDVFAPHILSYQREILQQYADASLAGACKDEWGFPGRFTPQTNDLWYSSFMAKAYEQQRNGRDLLRDMLLMTYGETGAKADRIAAVNHYMEMYWKRNGEIETDYYHAIKEIFGRDAMSGTHPTWFPFPDNREIFKNGLSWWVSKRDVAQTDEATPFSVRTALAKKMWSPLWFNMYYDKDVNVYHKDIWRAALAGGRLNYHPLWPHPIDKLTTSLLEDSVMMAESRVKLLNYISAASPDCPVAVVFGHPAALNWNDGATFADVGLNIANGLWKEGYYTDLIPSSEIVNGSLKINADGKIQYGPQQYEAVIYYHPEYDQETVASFFNRAAAAGKTSVYRVGEWTINYNGQPFDGITAMGNAVKKADTLSAVRSVIAALQAKNILPQTKGDVHTVAGFPSSVMPKASGQLRLIDGTLIVISGEHNLMGDSINKSFQADGHTIYFDAIGVAAVRLDKKGEVEALAGGGLKSFKSESLSFDLPERTDVVLYKEKGKWKGIVQNNNGYLPETLLSITTNWTRLSLPQIYKPE